MANLPLEDWRDGVNTFTFNPDQFKDIAEALNNLNSRLRSLEMLQRGPMGNVVADSVDAQVVLQGGQPLGSSHGHGNITWDGKVGSTANKPLITGTGGIVTTSSFGTSANTFCQGNDSRLSNARTPTSHASSSTTYGVGSSTNYGHIKLYDSVGASNTDGAPTQKSVKEALDGKSSTSHNHDSAYMPLGAVQKSGMCMAEWKTVLSNPSDANNPLKNTRCIFEDMDGSVTYTYTNASVQLYQGTTLGNRPAPCITTTIGGVQVAWTLFFGWVFGSSPFVADKDTRLMLTQSTAVPTSDYVYADFSWTGTHIGQRYVTNGQYACPWGYRLASLNDVCIGTIDWKLLVHWWK